MTSLPHILRPKFISRLLCWSRTRMAWPYPIMGHAYIELCDTSECQVLKCMNCGHVSTAFYFNPDDRMAEIVASMPKSGEGKEK